ncbi:alpha/beta fold hydrolase [Jatrophihabitans sp. DSM 45814]
MKVKIPAIIGGAVGAAGLVAAAGVVHGVRQVEREKSKIDSKSAAGLGALSIDRQSRVLAEDGVSLYVEEVGPSDAPLTVVFVHGFTLNLGSFHFQRLALREAFGDGIRMVFYDERSHGRSDKSPSADCTIEQLGRDLATVIDAIVPTGPIVLVGHSMGGMTIMAMADQRPADFLTRIGSTSSAETDSGVRTGTARIPAVVFINTSGGNLRTVTLGLPSFVSRWSGPVMPVVLRRAAKNAELVELGRALGKDLAWAITKRLSFAAPDVDPAVVAFATNMISATPVDVVSDFWSTLMTHDGTMGLQNLSGCRALIFGADHDALTPLSHAEAIAAALPRAELIEVEGAGHLLMLERPEVVNGPLVDFVGEAVADAGAVGRRTGSSTRRARTVR